MNIIEILINGGNVPSGTFKKLVSTGVFPLSFITQYNIYKTFLIHYNKCKDDGVKNSTTLAVTFTSDEVGVSERTVYTSIKKMESLQDLFQ